MNKIAKTIISIVLLVAVIFLAYKLYEEIMTPIRFEKAYNVRSEVVKEKMMKIRDAEVAFMSKYNHYTADFDSLINFIKKDSLEVIKSEGVVPDSIYLNAKNPKEAELTAIKLGIIKRDTIRISVKDSLFAKYNVDTLAFIPYNESKEKFQLNAGTIKTLSKTIRPVFELKVHNNSFTQGLDRQLVINLNDKARDNDKFPGYIVGSMEEVSTSGNWD